MKTIFRLFRATAWMPFLLSLLLWWTVAACGLPTRPATGASSAPAGTVSDCDSADAASADLLLQQLPADMPEVLLRRKAYLCSYNPRTLQPNYVAWHLTADHADGPVDRKITNFHADEEVPVPQVTTRDYSHSGYDRGHLCPAADNKWDETAMRESFLMTNVCPQHPELNSGDWQEIEKACRRRAVKSGGLYIVCGPIFLKNGHREIIGREVRIPVPDAFFKVVLCVEDDAPWAVGFICRNEGGNRTKRDYVNSLAEVERVTGLCFFPYLSAGVRRVVANAACPEDLLR